MVNNPYDLFHVLHFICTMCNAYMYAVCNVVNHDSIVTSKQTNWPRQFTIKLYKWTEREKESDCRQKHRHRYLSRLAVWCGSFRFLSTPLSNQMNLSVHALMIWMCGRMIEHQQPHGDHGTFFTRKNSHSWRYFFSSLLLIHRIFSRFSSKRMPK